MAYILIVEDELVLAHQLAVALESAGHETALARTAKQGVDAAREAVPDLVLLDLRLPDGSGLDVISELLEHDPSVRAATTSPSTLSDATL